MLLTRMPQDPDFRLVNHWLIPFQFAVRTPMFSSDAGNGEKHTGIVTDIACVWLNMPAADLRQGNWLYLQAGRQQ